MWDDYQRERLAWEQKLLQARMPDFRFYQPMHETYVSGHWVSNANRYYEILIQLPPGYPDECPSTYITNPSPLLGRGRRDIASYGTSHNMHTFRSDRVGSVKLCTVRPEFWDASFSIEQLIIKAMLWITAYEAHTTTGQNIAELLSDHTR